MASKPLIVEIRHDRDQAIAALLEQLQRGQLRIENLIRKEGTLMAQVDDRLDALTTQLGDLASDLDRELADLKSAVSGDLTADQSAKFDSLTAKVQAMKDAIDQADPAQANPPASQPLDQPPTQQA